MALWWKKKVDWACYRCILHLQQYSHRLNLFSSGLRLRVGMIYRFWGIHNRSQETTRRHIPEENRLHTGSVQFRDTRQQHGTVHWLSGTEHVYSTWFSEGIARQDEQNQLPFRYKPVNWCSVRTAVENIGTYHSALRIWFPRKHEIVATKMTPKSQRNERLYINHQLLCTDYYLFIKY